MRRNNQEVLGVVPSTSQIEDRQAIAIRLFGAFSHSPAAIGKTGFPQLYLRASNGGAIESITKIGQRLLARSLHQQGRIGDQDQVS